MAGKLEGKRLVPGVPAPGRDAAAVPDPPAHRHGRQRAGRRPRGRRLRARARRRGARARGRPLHGADHYLDLFDARELADGWTTSADVERTKPEPDLVAAAVEKAEASAKRQPVTSEARQSGDAVMVGDSTWDCEAAARAGIATVGVLTGDFSLREAGVACVFERLEDLLAQLGQTPLSPE